MANYVQIAYQPARRIFGGVYLHPDLKGGCDFISTDGAQAYFTGGKTLSPTAKATLLQTLYFWMGQHSLVNVKDKLKIEVIYESITADKNVTVTVYQNNRASITGSTVFSGTTHSDDDLVGRLEPKGSGRMFLIDISIPTDCVAPIVDINYSVNELHWSEKAIR